MKHETLTHGLDSTIAQNRCTFTPIAGELKRKEKVLLHIPHIYTNVRRVANWVNGVASVEGAMPSHVLGRYHREKKLFSPLNNCLREIMFVKRTVV